MAEKQESSIKKSPYLRIPPQSLDAEMALLGSIMLRPDVMFEIIDFVKHESFYAEKHRIIFRHMFELFGKSTPIDLLSLSSTLRDKKCSTRSAAPHI
jgi:replicative DNA helicase